MDESSPSSLAAPAFEATSKVDRQSGPARTDSISPQSAAEQPAPPANRKSVNLRAFNLYAAKVRKETREQNPRLTGYEIERLIGKQWAKLAEEQRREFTDQAKREREEMLQRGLIHTDSQEKGRRKKRKNEVDLLALALKQSKPEEKEMLLQHLPGLVKPKKSKPGHREDATIGDGSPAAALIGTPVTGIIDGMFDAGYFVTLRVGEKRQAFRGVVFRPDLPPPAGRSDIAPKVWTLETRPMVNVGVRGGGGDSLCEVGSRQENPNGLALENTESGAIDQRNVNVGVDASVYETAGLQEGERGQAAEGGQEMENGQAIVAIGPETESVGGGVNGLEGAQREECVNAGGTVAEQENLGQDGMDARGSLNGIVSANGHDGVNGHETVSGLDGRKGPTEATGGGNANGHGAITGHERAGFINGVGSIPEQASVLRQENGGERFGEGTLESGACDPPFEETGTAQELGHEERVGDAGQLRGQVNGAGSAEVEVQNRLRPTEGEELTRGEAVHSMDEG